MAKHIIAFDEAEPMLEKAREKLATMEAATNNTKAHIEFHQGENRALPPRVAADGIADIVEGWSIAHLASWFPETWEEELEKVIVEMKRVAKKEAKIILFETLGTNRTEPKVPSPRLEKMYGLLENSHGFSRHAIRTDYKFSSVLEAHEVLDFFFGAMDIPAAEGEGEQGMELK